MRKLANHAARDIASPAVKMGNRSLFPGVAVPLAFFCTLFFRHRKKSVSAPWDGKSLSAPESARQAPPKGNFLGRGFSLRSKQGGFPLAPLHPLRIANRSNSAPHRAASPPPAPGGFAYGKVVAYRCKQGAFLGVNNRRGPHYRASRFLRLPSSTQIPTIPSKGAPFPMKHTNLTMGILFGFFLLCALSMGNRVYFVLATIIFLSWIFAFISVRMAEKTVQVSNALSGQKVNRGEVVSMEIAVSHKGLLPIAPIALHMRATSNTPAGVIYLTHLGKRRQRVTHRFVADHVGAMFPGVESYVVSDIFGFFKKEHQPDLAGQELLVLPVPFEVEPLTFAAGDMGVETMKRAMEDPSSPSDFRNYQQGDPLKRIHWKMSARKRELIVRQFEEPALPDALVMLDTSPPHLNEGVPKENAAFLQDALLETAASVVACQIRQDNQVRLPLVGDRPMEYSSHMGLPVLLEELARCTFNETERFERVLMMQMAELRKLGAVVVITTRLTSEVADLLIRMKRMGPNVRLYYVTFRTDRPERLALVGRLQQAGVEVNYVTPQGS